MTALQQARAEFDAGRFGKAHEEAVAGLAESPDDVELLRLAGRAGVEAGSDDAADHLRKVTELEPDSAEAWRDLADALAAEGRTEEANEAFRKVLDIEPDDEVALTALGHSAFQGGERDEGVSILERVASQVPGASTAAISLVDMYRTLGQPTEALAAARKIAVAAPERPIAQLDVAELALETGELDEAGEAFGRLRELLEQPEGQVAAIHGAIKVELARGGAERALGLAREASAIDTLGRTAGVLGFLEAEVGAAAMPAEETARGATMMFIEAQEAPPTREEAEGLLDATLRDLRRELDDQVEGGEPGG
jgi:tetratricopeptide (TPR) repeat protein